MIEITQHEIKSHWDIKKYKEPLVTIRCTTYNHEKFISTAIE